MNNWNQFSGRVLTVADLADGFVATVSDQALLAASGEDAAKFLHGQLTNDVEHLNQNEVRLAGYCTPKGRLQATFLMWRDAESVYLQLPRELAAPLQKRLQMFIMRAKAKLVDASDLPQYQVVLGLGGAKANAVLEAHFGALPPAPYTRIDHELGALLRLGDALGAPRYQWLMSRETVQALWPALSTSLMAGGDQAWSLAGIHAGVPQVTLNTQEQFVPQMINFELLGGVNFKKGCYPGQEIVARSQYLGKLKRRTALVSIEDAFAVPGTEVFAPSDPEQPCGMIVNAAQNGTGGIDALVEMKLAALEQGEVRLGSAAGAPLSFQVMPYALDALEL